METLIKCNASIAGFGDALKQQTAEGWETIIVSLRFFDANEEGYTNNELDFFCSWVCRIHFVRPFTVFTDRTATF